MSFKSKIPNFISPTQTTIGEMKKLYWIISVVKFPFVEQKWKELNLDQGAKALLFFDILKGPTTSGVTNLFHKCKCIFILVPSNPTNLFQPLDISVNKSAKCFVADEYQNWCANEVLKQLARGVKSCDVNCDIRLKNIKPLLANWPF